MAEGGKGHLDNGLGLFISKEGNLLLKVDPLERVVAHNLHSPTPP